MTSVTLTHIPFADINKSDRTSWHYEVNEGKFLSVSPPPRPSEYFLLQSLSTLACINTHHTFTHASVPLSSCCIADGSDLAKSQACQVCPLQSTWHAAEQLQAREDLHPINSRSCIRQNKMLKVGVAQCSFFIQYLFSSRQSPNPSGLTAMHCRNWQQKSGMKESTNFHNNVEGSMTSIWSDKQAKNKPGQSM